MTADNVKSYYESNLKKVLDPRMDESEIRFLLRKVSHSDLDSMIQVILAGVSVKGNKLDKVRVMDDYFRSMERTQDLCKNLYWEVK